MERALKPHDAAKWTAATYLPFLWRPDQHMFLKPEVTKDLAARVGHRFASDYEAGLDIGVYESLLDLAARTTVEVPRAEAARPHRRAELHLGDRRLQEGAGPGPMGPIEGLIVASRIRNPRLDLSKLPGEYLGGAMRRVSEIASVMTAISVHRRNGVETPEVLTVGHSTLPYERFLDLLRRANVSAVADVRTAPYSRLFPQFNRKTLSNELRTDGISYVFLGRELGGRPSERQLYRDGVADYERMARTAEFDQGLDRLLEGARKYRIALMCSERDPLDCHRCLLVGRALARRGIRVSHLLDDGKVVSHAEIDDKLLELSGLDAEDLFAPREDRLAAAYRERARKVAFAEPQPGPGDPIAAE